MTAQLITPTSLAVDEAIMRVLEAETSARAAVEQCVADADEIRQDARVRARAIAERAAERVAKVHRWMDASIKGRVEHLNLERASLQQPATPNPEEPARLARALDRLAAELSGGRE
jgi:vacuolar-type H+-ATPase subunit H